MSPTGNREHEYQDGDTIVVKGENWASTPNNMEEVDLDVDRLLEQLNNNTRHLESPEDQSLDTPAVNSSSQHDDSTRLLRQGVTQRVGNTSTMEERLSQMAEIRALPWRDGFEDGAAVETGGNSRKKQIRFGCLLATRGEIQQKPCLNCQKGRGKFQFCIALDGFFKGACASCQLSGRPNKCSIKKNDDATSSPLMNTLGEATASTPSRYEPASNPPESKRRRTDAVPDWESARPQWEQELGESHARQQMNEMGQRSWATVNTPIPMSMAAVGMNRSRNPSESLEHRNSIGGWAAVNQQPLGPSTQNFNNIDGGVISSHRSTEEQARREETMIDDRSEALIDTLPKRKQREVYMLVSGLQMGINQLQNELNSLRKALGIDDEG